MTGFKVAGTWHSLLRIIGRISKNTGVKTSQYSIAALDDNAVFVSIKKLVIDEQIPLRMKQFTTTVGHERFIRTLPSHSFCSKVFEGIWELRHGIS
jgi:hypothetical protein